MKRKIAITGGIGSGKSTLCRQIREMGYPVFSCDELYKNILQSPDYVEEVAARFPACITEGKIDKTRLAATVFKNETERKALNAIAHPLVMSALSKNMDECTSDLVFAEVPLLFEGGFQSQFDNVIVLLRERANRISSVVRRDGLLPQEVEDRIFAQFDYYSKEAQEIFKQCNAVVIDNSQSEEVLKRKIKEVLLKFA